MAGGNTLSRYSIATPRNATSLDPMPPKESKLANIRYLDIHEDDELDEVQLRAWVTQASALPGEPL